MAREAYVLVVDDDPVILGMIETRLEMAGYRVTTATSAWQEVVQAEGLKIGLIITDVNMPGKTGIEAYEYLRTCKTLSPALPVIFVTGMKIDEVAKLLPADPKIRILSKPIDFGLLETAIKDLTGVVRPLSLPAQP